MRIPKGILYGATAGLFIGLLATLLLIGSYNCVNMCTSRILLDLVSITVPCMIVFALIGYIIETTFVTTKK